MQFFDSHVHCFPTAIADRAVAKLAKVSAYIPQTDGTFEDTVAKETAWGAKGFILLNIATSPRQEKSVNDFLIAHHGGPVVSFGSVHPASEHALYELDRCRDAGLPGIKFHADYQDFTLDDDRAMALYEEVAARDMVMLFHGGFDPAYLGSDRSAPRRVARVAAAFPQARLIVAHLGGCRELSETMAYLSGGNVYFDLSMVHLYLAAAEVAPFMRSHGLDKFLFATDCPWSGAPQAIDFVETLGLTAAEREMIYYRNAEKLLNITN